MPTFDNGWICRTCWTANRERDGSCYRCHKERPDYSDPVPIFSQRPAAAPAPAPTPEPTAPRFAAVASEPEPVENNGHACAGCGEALLPDAKFCVRCGLSTAKDAKPAHRPTPPIAAETPPPVTFTPPSPASPAPVAATSADEAPASRKVSLPHVEMPHVEMPRIQMPRVALPKPSAGAVTESLRAAWGRVLSAMANLPPVLAVRRVAAATSAVWRRVLAFREQRTEVWLFVGWLGLMVTATVLLFAYAGVGRGEVAGQLLNGMLVVLALSVLSALTAALTITLLKPMRGDMAEMNERLRVLSDRISQSRPSPAPTEMVQAMRPREETQRAS